MNSRFEPRSLLSHAKMSIYFLPFHFTLPFSVDFSEVSHFLSDSEMRFAVMYFIPTPISQQFHGNLGLKKKKVYLCHMVRSISEVLAQAKLIE